MALDALALAADLQARIKTDITAGTARAEALLRDASAAVRNYTGQQFTAGTTTEALLRPKNQIVQLPQRPVTDVDAVVDLYDNVLLFTWRGDDRVLVGQNPLGDFAFQPWVNGITHVKVTYDHGYDEIPDDIIAVVCQIAARAYGMPADESGTSQEAIAGYSYSIGGAAAAGPLGMLADERAILDAYRFPTIGSIRVGP